MNNLDRIICILILPSLFIQQIIEVTNFSALIIVRFMFFGLMFFRITKCKIPSFFVITRGWLLAIVIIIGLLRTNGTLFDMSNNVSLSLFFLMLLIFFANIARKKNAIDYFFLSIFGLLFLNITLVFLGVLNKNIYSLESTSSAVILSKLIPIYDFKRQLFPISSGVNNYGVELGLLTLYFIVNTKKPFYPLFLIITLTCLLLCDTRSSILFIFIVLFLKFFFLLKNILFKWLYVTSAVAIILSFASISFISRDNNELQTLNSRSLIWSFTATKIPDFSISEIFFGFGRFSSIPLGVSKVVELEYVANSDYISYHNNFFQFFCDWGLLGFLLLIYLFIWSFITSKKYKHYDIMVYILYLFFIGFTEATVSYHYTTLLLIFLFIIIKLDLNYGSNIRFKSNYIKKNHIPIKDNQLGFAQNEIL